MRSFEANGICHNTKLILRRLILRSKAICKSY